MTTFLVCLICCLISFLPIIEFRGAVALAMSNIWGEYALSPALAYLVCAIGGSLSCFFIAFLFLVLKKKLSKIKFFNHAFNRIDTFALKMLENDSSKTNKITDAKKMRLVFLFCALPLPLTGVWAAGALCSCLNLNYFKSVLTLVLANLVSAGCVAIICFCFGEFIDLLLYVMLIIFTLQIIFKIICLVAEKINSKKIVKK